MKTFPAMKHARTLLIAISFHVYMDRICGICIYVLISSNHTASARDKESERENKDEETFAVDKIVFLGP